MLQSMGLQRVEHYLVTELNRNGDSEGKESVCNPGDLGFCDTRDLGSIPGWEDPLLEGMATHSSILA